MASPSKYNKTFAIGQPGDQPEFQALDPWWQYECGVFDISMSTERSLFTSLVNDFSRQPHKYMRINISNYNHFEHIYKIVEYYYDDRKNGEGVDKMEIKGSSDFKDVFKGLSVEKEQESKVEEVEEE